MNVSRATLVRPAIAQASRTVAQAAALPPRQTATVSSDKQTDLVRLIDQFLSGDHSRRLASEIEGVVVQEYQDADWYDEVGTALASYAPGERGAHYVDEAGLEATLRRLRDQLG